MHRYRLKARISVLNYSVHVFELQSYICYRYYNLRTSLKTNSKTPAKIEVTLPKATGKEFDSIRVLAKLILLLSYGDHVHHHIGCLVCHFVCA